MDKAGVEGYVRVYNDGGRDMLHRGSIVVNVVLALCLVASQVSAEVFAYPKNGQSQQQFEQDQFGCHQWAKGQTGVDPTQPQQSAAAPPPQRGGAVHGAAGGAAVGAVGGAIAGDAGKGAAVGAGSEQRRVRSGKAARTGRRPRPSSRLRLKPRRGAVSTIRPTPPACKGVGTR